MHETGGCNAAQLDIKMTGSDESHAFYFDDCLGSRVPSVRAVD